MRSRTNCIIGSGEVYTWAQEHLLRARLVKDHGPRCTAAAVVGIVLRAAAQSISVCAACRDLAKAPSDHAVLTALEEGLPKTLPVLERRLNETLTGNLPRNMRRRAWQVAIDWHLVPYFGWPFRSRNEICRSQPKQGTAQFHTYATACVVEYGRRYTLALTWVTMGTAARSSSSRSMVPLWIVICKMQQIYLSVRTRSDSDRASPRKIERSTPAAVGLEGTADPTWNAQAAFRSKCFNSPPSDSWQTTSSAFLLMLPLRDFEIFLRSCCLLAWSARFRFKDNDQEGRADAVRHWGPIVENRQ